MNPFDSFRVAIGALKTNTLRSFLAMLGVIIGVASVIVMVSVASGASQAIEERIRALGTNLLIISPGSFTSGGRRAGEGTATALSEGDLQLIRAKVPGVAAVAGVISGQAPVVAGAANWTTSIDGVNEDFLEVRDWALAEGRNFTEAEMRSAAKVVILGATVARELYGAAPVLGEQLRIKNVPFTVVGLLTIKGQSGWGSDQDDTALVPISTARRRLFGAEQTVPDNLRTIMVEVASAEEMADAQAEIETLLRERRRVRSGAPDDFRVRDMADFIRTRTETQSILKPPARCHSDHLADRRRHRHHEHHAGIRDRAHQGDRAPHGGRRATPRHPQSVPDRGGDLVRDRRADRIGDRRRCGARHVHLGRLADSALARARADRACLGGIGGRVLRLLPGAPRLANEPDRRAAL